MIINCHHRFLAFNVHSLYLSIFSSPPPIPFGYTPSFPSLLISLIVLFIMLKVWYPIISTEQKGYQALTLSNIVMLTAVSRSVSHLYITRYLLSQSVHPVSIFLSSRLQISNMYWQLGLKSMYITIDRILPEA